MGSLKGYPKGPTIYIMYKLYPKISNLGATPSQYGFVFGITNMAAFLTAPFFGRYGSKLGPKLLYNTGAFVQAIAGISFGFLDYIDDTTTFLGLSYTFR
jgi:MFS family permease